MRIGNLFADSASPVAGERFDVLLSHRNLVVERIVSSPDLTPSEYVQSHDEWVVLLRGRARLDVAGDAVELKAGDYLFLPAGTAHTVKATFDDALWLAVHLHAA
jgi:cupin 2 domain-containing protein